MEPSEKVRAAIESGEPVSIVIESGFEQRARLAERIGKIFLRCIKV